MFVCVYLCMCVCMYVRMYVCLYVYVCMCVCMCVYIHIYMCVRVCVCKEFLGLRIIGNWASSLDQFWTRQFVQNEPIFDWLSRTGRHLNEIFEPKLGQLNVQQLQTTCKEFSTVNYNSLFGPMQWQFAEWQMTKNTIVGLTYDFSAIKQWIILNKMFSKQRISFLLKKKSNLTLLAENLSINVTHGCLGSDHVDGS